MAHSASEQAIVDATSRLLGRHAARDLSVAMVLEEAGVSRATFYHYFESKWDVVTLLAHRAMQEIYQLVQGYVVADETVSHRDALRRAITLGCETWAANDAVMRAVLDNWRDVPELRALLTAVLVPLQTALASEVDLERSRGGALPGPATRPLVAAMLWASLNCLHVASLDDVPHLKDEAYVAVLLTEIWMRTLYGELPAA